MTGGNTSSALTAAGWLTTGQVARKIGCSDDTVRRRVAAGKIPAQRPGTRELRIPASWVRQYLAPFQVVRRKPQ